MKTANKIKNMLMTILSVLIIGKFNMINVNATENIASGIYQVSNEVYHETEIGMSMARSYLLDTMTVKVTKENVVFTIGFMGTEYMENYRMKVNDIEVPVEIIEENDEEGLIKLQVTTDSLNNDLKACIYVGPMERDVEFGVIPNYDTLTLIEAIEDEETIETTEEVEVVEINENINSESSKEIGSSKKISVLTGLTLLGVLVIAIVVFKNRK